MDTDSLRIFVFRFPMKSASKKSLVGIIKRWALLRGAYKLFVRATS